MNAHSAWTKWQEQFRVSNFDRDPTQTTMYDYKGIGLEGAFKAGCNAGWEAVVNERDGERLRLDALVKVVRRHVTELHDLLGRDYGVR